MVLMVVGCIGVDGGGFYWFVGVVGFGWWFWYCVVWYVYDVFWSIDW